MNPATAVTSLTELQSLTKRERRVLQNLLRRITAGLISSLRDRLVGIYLYGSLVTGDFDFDISDIDLVVVLRNPLDKRLFAKLHRFHRDIVGKYPAWEDRLELAYISAAGLRTFRTQSCTIGIISPGEPFHLIQAGADWLISWYALRQTGIPLQGPSIKTLIIPISLDDWLDAVREHICAYRDSVKTAPDKASLAYMVLTVARGACTLERRRDVSKVQAAHRLAALHPRWADLMRRALLYRHDPDADTVTVEQLRPDVEAYLSHLLSSDFCGENC